MSAADLLWTLWAAGFKARVDGARLMVSPAERLTPELTAAIHEHKAGLLELLREQAADPFAVAVPWGQGPWGWLPHPASPEYEALLIPAAEFRAFWAALEAHNAAVRARAAEAAKQEEAEEPEEPEEVESRRVGSFRGSSADLAEEPAEEPSKESPRTSSDSSGSSGSSASFAVDTQPQPAPSAEGPEDAEGGEGAVGDPHRHGPDVSAAADEVVLDLGEIEHVDR